MKKVFLGLTLVFLLVTISFDRDVKNIVASESFPLTVNPFENLYTPWVDSVFNSLTPDQRIGQLFFAAAYSNRDKKHADDIIALIRQYHLGGLIFFQGGPMRQALLANRYQAIAQTPMLIAMDAEWGLGMRLDSCMSFPRQMALGAIADVNPIYRMGNEIGRQCRRMGVHINFAPVVDINTNPANPVIGARSFGENSHDVAQRSISYMNGLQQQHILTTAKHFPGHGNTSVDSHHALPVVNDSYAELYSLEWHPYREMMKNNLTGVMAAHVHVPELDSTPNLAASLSRRVLTDILRDSLHFTGLVYTDALNMKGVTDHFKSGELEVKALKAGVDVLLMPNDIPKAVAAIKTAINNGRIDRKQIEMSCRRILAAKEWAGLNRYRPIDINNLLSDLNNPQADLLNRQLVEASLTIVQNNNRILPLTQLDKNKTAILITGRSQPNNFLQSLNLYEENDYFYLDKNTPNVGVLLETLKKYSRVIVGLHNTTSNPYTGYGILSNVRSFVGRLAESTDVILCLFAPPYALSSFTGKDRMAAIVVSYQDTPLAQDYTAQLLYGAVAGKGALPVSVDSVYRYGHGLQTAGGLRLKYSIPEEVLASSRALTAIDTMVQNAIDVHTMPGCQILAARNGVVFFKKEYGQTRYDDQAEPVDPKHIYDLASLSKIAGALPSVMLLYDNGKFKLGNKLMDYLPEMKGSDKASIIMTDILTHQSRLLAHIPFHLHTMEPLDKTKELLSDKYSKLYSIRLSSSSYLNSQRRFKDGYFTTSEDDTHRIQVADNMFVFNSFRDSIFFGIRDSKLLTRKQYVYSDLGFILLTSIIERLSEQPLESFASQQFYTRLGAATMGYLPLNRFPKRRIVPTSNDTIFRHQWLQGYVHDENAALLGGVSGHAGLFSNANDLAKLMQMYMNMGTYGGEPYINEKTLKEFTASPFARQGNRRGIGFDKPDLKPAPTDLMGKNASKESFGHTGFTGTIVWMDPKNGLLFVFLSNRVCPDATNIKITTTMLRARIYEVFVNAIEE